MATCEAEIPLVDTLSGRAGRLFAAYRDGDTAKLPALVETVTPILWHTARSQRLDAATAEDAVQTVWLSLIGHADSIREPMAVLQWLLIATRREAWRLARADAKVEVREFAYDREDVAAPERTDDQVLAAAGNAQLWEHIGRLSLRCQQLLRVIAFADRPDYEAVAGALGMPVGSIGPTRGRCLAKLRTQLAEDPRWEGGREA